METTYEGFIGGIDRNYPLTLGKNSAPVNNMTMQLDYANGNWHTSLYYNNTSVEYFDPIWNTKIDMSDTDSIIVGKISNGAITVTLQSLVDAYKEALSAYKSKDPSLQFNKLVNTISALEAKLNTTAPKSYPLDVVSGAKTVYIIAQIGTNWRGTGMQFFLNIDGRQSDYNTDHYMVKGDYAPGTFQIKKTTKGGVRVTFDSALAAFNQIVLDFPTEKEKAEKAIKYLDRLKDVAGVRQTNADKKTSEAEHKMFLLNTKDAEVVSDKMKEGLLSIKQEYIEKYYNKDVNLVDDVYARLQQEPFKGKGLGYMLIDSRRVSRDKRTHEDAIKMKTGEDEYQAVRNYFTSDMHGRYYDLKPNYKSLIRKYNTNIFDNLEARYMAKNVFKVVSVINAKANLKTIDILYARLGSVGFEGSYHISFEDGSSFRINTQAVCVFGSYIMADHYRFPLTFHEVVYTDGSKYKKLSEEQMVNNFGKNLKP